MQCEAHACVRETTSCQLPARRAIAYGGVLSVDWQEETRQRKWVKLDFYFLPRLGTPLPRMVRLIYSQTAGGTKSKVLAGRFRVRALASLPQQISRPSRAGQPPPFAYVPHRTDVAPARLVNWPPHQAAEAGFVGQRPLRLLMFDPTPAQLFHVARR